MFGNVFEGRRVLVTGHTGFKGCWLTLWLYRLGAKVIGYSQGLPTTPSMFDVMSVERLITDSRGDICDLETIERILERDKPEFVFHLAAQPIVRLSYVDPVETFRTNVIGSLSVLEAIRRTRTRCTVVMITSDKCYENVEWSWGYRENDRLGGLDPYSASKAAAECAIRSSCHSFFKNGDPARLATARAGNVIGGGDWAPNRIVPDCVRAWAERQPVTIRAPKSTRPWQHVLEPLSGYLRTAQELEQRAEIHGQAFNFGPRSEETRTVLDLLEAIAGHWKFPERAEKVKVISNEDFHEAGLLKLNCDKALHELGWRPALDFHSTARMTAEWYDRYYHRAHEGLLEFTFRQIDQYVEAAAEREIPWTR
jgi:CDP-glucose 4,6-dehydratase